ncbi:hypothetical protein CE91St42_13920 [Oscillospiraceae bacterium]|nr:hypothetical protein CE91St42_13920 [Oscillospiraceae bacterium]
MTEINQLVDLELKRQLKALPGLETGSAEQTAAVKNLTALYEARINEDKLLLDAKEKQEARESELRLKEADREEKKVDRMFHAGIALLEIGLPLVCYGHWFRKGLKFEETGSITSSMMRNLINKFRTKK